MPSRFTSWLALALLAAGCTALPDRTHDATIPPRGAELAETAAIERASGGQSAAALRTVPATPVPPLQSGNRALFERAKALLREGNMTAAEVLFAELTESQPELAGPWANLGSIAAARGEDEEARRHLERAIDANPQNCEALTMLGVLSRTHGLFAEAEGYYRRCIEAQPFFPAAHLNLGILYELYMGRLGEALAAYNEYQALIPEPDVKVAGWVLDLERRVAAVAQR